MCWKWQLGCIFNNSFKLATMYTSNSELLPWWPEDSLYKGQMMEMYFPSHDIIMSVGRRNSFPYATTLMESNESRLISTDSQHAPQSRQLEGQEHNWRQACRDANWHTMKANIVAQGMLPISRPSIYVTIDFIKTTKNTFSAISGLWCHMTVMTY